MEAKGTHRIKKNRQLKFIGPVMKKEGSENLTFIGYIEDKESQEK